jgi:hypothetical protein
MSFAHWAWIAGCSAGIARPAHTWGNSRSWLSLVVRPHRAFGILIESVSLRSDSWFADLRCVRFRQSVQV